MAKYIIREKPDVDYIITTKKNLLRKVWGCRESLQLNRDAIECNESKVFGDRGLWKKEGERWRFSFMNQTCTYL